MSEMIVGPTSENVQAALGVGGGCFEGFWCWPVDAAFISAMCWDQAVEMVLGQPEMGRSYSR